jgi:hypothetical protein
MVVLEGAVSGAGPRVRPAETADRPAVEDFLTRWNALRVARRGAVEQPLDHPALIAADRGRRLRVLTSTDSEDLRSERVVLASRGVSVIGVIRDAVVEVEAASAE